MNSSYPKFIVEIVSFSVPKLECALSEFTFVESIGKLLIPACWFPFFNLLSSAVYDLC
jgi:hypothetical protein